MHFLTKFRLILKIQLDHEYKCSNLHPVDIQSNNNPTEYFLKVVLSLEVQSEYHVQRNSQTDQINHIQKPEYKQSYFNKIR